LSDKYAVIGNPVAHSQSPQIHAEFARQTGQDIIYTTLFCELDKFSETVDEFFSINGAKGLNVTLPFKNEAFEKVRLNDISFGGVIDAMAVNTISKREDGALVGHNTDGIGLVTDIEQNLEVSITGKRVLLMGAGGATRGVMYPLLKKLEESPGLMVVANRTLEKAVSLVSYFKQHKDFASHGVSAAPYDALAGAQFDLVINATSASLSGEMPSLPRGIFAPGALAYDMVYGRDTPFMAFARNEGARAVDGLGMLVEQAAESFFIWRGVRPQTAAVIKKLRG
jgi:shikimate dehydrogenase